MKKSLIIANWKLNGNKYFINDYIKKLLYEINKNKINNVIIAPPLIYLQKIIEKLKNSNIKVCAQNVDINLFGAFTGEISVAMLKDIGVKYVLIGHSERRINHNENDEIIYKKFKIVKENNLIPILCIGETYNEKKNGKTKEVCYNQINYIIKKMGIKVLENCIIAYEPVWAIGKDISINYLEIQKIHKFIRSKIYLYDKKISKEIVIQYGGSVTDKNIKELLIQPDINGVLVGNSSLNFDIFLKIIKFSKNFQN
ncbi:triose-phosphate isomerase [Enterobacterales bacterium endosymbiont of Anomoneura mori]|uniref:triose-phosphate isomerase n=1 Tax=Enterobacterales bacterium endosymbiont of Anomoneura mori TaxID=3132096 RepID=UPI00399CC81E